MASLKDLKNRIGSVKSTQKITKAMKMVAAAKLRKAQERAEQARPYTEKLGEMMASLTAGKDTANAEEKSLLSGTGADQTHLIIVATSSRGLCGGFNSSITKAAMIKINQLTLEGKDVKILCIGSKGYDALKRLHKNKILDTVQGLQKKEISYEMVDEVVKSVIEMFDNGEFDICSIFYNKFQSAISQIVTEKKLIPLEIEEIENAPKADSNISFEYEPEEEEILNYLLPKNMSMQIYSALLENQASEMGARMTAMDNATRNAGDMIDKLTLQYNRSRQAAITTELIEIISGAEAL